MISHKPQPKQIAVLLSNRGTGSNLQAIIDACKQNKINGQIAVVVSDKADAYGLIRAAKNHLPTIINPFTKFADSAYRDRYGAELAQILKEKYHTDLVILAGWMIILPPNFVAEFPHRIINLHPGLIPDKPKHKLRLSNGSIANPLLGEMTTGAIQKAIDSGVTISGSTTHFITPKVDWGPVIMRAEEKIRPHDTVDSYYSRLKTKEHIILPLSIKLFCAGKLIVKDGLVTITDNRYRKHRT